MTKTFSPPVKPSRVSVPVTAEVLATFERLAKAGNMSTGRAIAEWLGDTVEAAEFMASTIERARASPKVVMREMHAYAMGLADETGELMRKMQAKGIADRAGVPGRVSGTSDTSRAAAALIPPSCNTGGKLPEKVKSVKRVKTGFPLPPAKVQAYADTNGSPPKAPK